MYMLNLYLLASNEFDILNMTMSSKFRISLRLLGEFRNTLTPKSLFKRDDGFKNMYPERKT